MFIKLGLVKLFLENQGMKPVILKIACPGHCLGLFSLSVRNRYDFSALALEDSEVHYFNMDVFKEVLAENGKFASAILQLFNEESLLLIRRLINMQHKQVPGRIAEALLFFSQEVYQTNPFTLPISRQELADLTFSTKESVSRTLTEFKNDRMIDIDDRKVMLKSMNLLDILSKMG
jgi:CRP-like cAMP-binding protein